MNVEAARKIADALLYEGYMLYPYRPSAIKNRQRWSFGILYPPAFREVRAQTERSTMHSECLLEVAADAPLQVDLQLRFLYLKAQRVFEALDGRLQPADSLRIDDRRIDNCEEGIERTVECQWTPGALHSSTFAFPDFCESKRLTNAAWQFVGVVTQAQKALSGRITIASEAVGQRFLKLIIDIENTTPVSSEIARDSALLCSLMSAHAILTASGGEFVSLLDPPPEMRSAVSGCRNVGNFPVLVGAEPERDIMLCSPIILYDYPQIAPESAGDFFDGTEMDEMLTLRVMTLTEQEKNEMRTSDPRVSELLRRTEQSAREQLMRTHGTIRSMSAAEQER